MNDGPKMRAEWQIVVVEFLNSGLTQKEFCKQKGLILGRFVYYLQLHRKQYQVKSPQDTSTFSEVIVKKSATSSADEIKIELPNGFRCQVACDIHPDQLKKILGTLLTC